MLLAGDRQYSAKVVHKLPAEDDIFENNFYCYRRDYKTGTCTANSLRVVRQINISRDADLQVQVNQLTAWDEDLLRD
jgi:hypothetical protein